MNNLVAFVIAGFAFAFLLVAFGANPVAAVVLAFALLGVAQISRRRMPARPASEESAS